MRYSYIYRMAYQVDQLVRLLSAERNGKVFGVQVAPPAPWHEAHFMLKLSRDGFNAAEIAVRTGRHVKTVEEVLRNRGMPRPVERRCYELTHRVFGVEEALRACVLPCRPDCRCDWRPIFSFEVCPLPPASEGERNPVDLPADSKASMTWSYRLLNWVFRYRP